MIDMNTAVIIAVAAGLIGLAFALRQRNFVLAQNEGTDRMKQIAAAIQTGAQAFLRREYRAVGILVLIVTIALAVLSAVPGSGMSILTAVAFALGALASGLSGYIGMYIAVRANVRTAQAASQSLNKGLRVAFASGTVMSTMVVSLALLGISILFIVFVNELGDAAQAASALAGFGFGGTSIAIFARVGGGIYTKAADVGADLVGKTEAGIPEDDPRNPATIADNVGDNVGDVAGMGSDLFESLRQFHHRLDFPSDHRRRLCRRRPCRRPGLPAFGRHRRPHHQHHRQLSRPHRRGRRPRKTARQHPHRDLQRIRSHRAGDYRARTDAPLWRCRSWHHHRHP